MSRALIALAAFAALATPAAAQTGPFDDYVPTTETLSTMTETPPDTELVKRLFVLAFTEQCSWAIDGGLGGIEPDVFDLTYRATYDDPADPPRDFRLYQFNCNGGAYNFSSVFYGWDSVDGVRPLTFAAPDVTPRYEDQDKNPDGTLVALSHAGWGARFLLVNPEVDPATGNITAVGYWRGIGDASDRGDWAFADGDYSLRTYWVDASYDGEINPVKIVDLGQPVAIDITNIDTTFVPEVAEEEEEEAE